MRRSPQQGGSLRCDPRPSPRELLRRKVDGQSRGEGGLRTPLAQDACTSSFLCPCEPCTGAGAGRKGLITPHRCGESC